MPRHFESFASLETFDPNLIGARERLIWLQRLRFGHDVWDDERHFGTLETQLANSKVPHYASSAG